MTPLEAFRLTSRVDLQFFNAVVRIWKRKGCPFSFTYLEPNVAPDSFFDALVEIARGA